MTDEAANTLKDPGRSADGRRVSRPARWAGAATCLMGGLMAILAQARGGEQVRLLCDDARPGARPAGAPGHSDVSMRLFVKRKDNAEIEAGKAFHITRGDWSYILDAEYISRVKALGWKLQGSMNGVTDNPEFAMKDKAGKPMLDHFQKPGRYWADMKNQAYRTWYVNRLKAWMDAGADSVQRDEPTTCKRTPVPVAAEFFKDVHGRFYKVVGRRFPLSVNLAFNGGRFTGKGQPVLGLFDAGMSEFYAKKGQAAPGFLKGSAEEAQRLRKSIVFTAGEPTDVPTLRRSIAGCYANGLLFIVPWDQFVGVKAPRYFGKPEETADLYGFVRACAPQLDGYEVAFTFLPAGSAQQKGAADSTGGNDPVAVRGGSGRVSATVRAKPGDREAAVVVHLVEWDGKPKPATVALRTARFFGGAALKVEMLTPVAYDRATHEKAEEAAQKLRKPGEYAGIGQAAAYAPLCKRTPLETGVEGDLTTVKVPELNPWGILVVTRR
jgi:hypothetical protein